MHRCEHHLGTYTSTPARRSPPAPPLGRSPLGHDSCHTRAPPTSPAANLLLRLPSRPLLRADLPLPPALLWSALTARPARPECPLHPLRSTPARGRRRRSRRRGAPPPPPAARGRPTAGAPRRRPAPRALQTSERRPRRRRGGKGRRGAGGGQAERSLTGSICYAPFSTSHDVMLARAFRTDQTHTTRGVPAPLSLQARAGNARVEPCAHLRRQSERGAAARRVATPKDVAPQPTQLLHHPQRCAHQRRLCRLGLAAQRGRERRRRRGVAVTNRQQRCSQHQAQRAALSTAAQPTRGAG